MKNWFTKIADATSGAVNKAKGLFISKKEDKQRQDDPIIQDEEDNNNINDYLAQNPQFKAQILINSKAFDKLIIELSWRKILRYKIAYATERRKQFQAKLVICEQAHNSRIIQEICIQVITYYNITINYNESKILAMVNQKILEESCHKILFSKDELRDYLQFYSNWKTEITKLTDLLSDYSDYELSLIYKQYLVDRGFELYNLDDCDEFKAIQLFRDDNEVQQWYRQKCKYIAEFDRHTY